jgi:hypothetical protein
MKIFFKPLLACIAVASLSLMTFNLYVYFFRLDCDIEKLVGVASKVDREIIGGVFTIMNTSFSLNIFFCMMLLRRAGPTDAKSVKD